MKLRVVIVCELLFVFFVYELLFGDFVFLGKGEEMMGGRKCFVFLVDVFEVFIGVLYLDQGFELVQ